MNGFGTELLNVAIGMAFVYLVMSLIASAMLEIVEAWLRTRAKYLWQGLGEILGDASARGMLPKLQPAAQSSTEKSKEGTAQPGAKRPAEFPAPPVTVTLEEFFKHPIIGGMYYGQYEQAVGTAVRRKLPAYISRESFSTAIIDLVSRQNTNPNVSAIQALRNGTEKLQKGTPVRTALEAITRLAGDDVTLVQKRLEEWYDGAMGRVTGWYKRHSQAMLLVIGLGLAWTSDVDSWRLAKDLLKNEPKRQALVSAASDYVAANPKPDTKVTSEQMSDYLKKLDDYGSPLDSKEPSEYPGRLLGLLVTAFAISLGAPFWFDLLNKFMVVRGSIKPKEQGAGDQAAGKAGSATTGAPTVFVRSGPI